MSSKPPINGVDSSKGECDGIRMSISVADPAAAQEMLRSLGNTSANVSFSVDCITHSGTHPCVITVGHLSRKQLEVVELAVEEGYYDKPREASLSSLSAQLDISDSAVSQRLTAVERKLVRSLVNSPK